MVECIKKSLTSRNMKANIHTLPLPLGHTHITDLALMGRAEERGSILRSKKDSENMRRD